MKAGDTIIIKQEGNNNLINATIKEVYQTFLHVVSSDNVAMMIDKSEVVKKVSKKIL